MVANSAVKELPQQDRPTFFHSSLLEEGLSSLPDDHEPSTEYSQVSPSSIEEDEKVWPNGDGGISQLDGANGSQPLMESRVIDHSEQNESHAGRPISQEVSTTEGAEVPPMENIILEVSRIISRISYVSKVFIYILRQVYLFP